MPNKILKLLILILFCAGFVVFGLNGSRVTANSGGPPASRTGAPGELTCAISGCHESFPLNSPGGVLSISGLPATYTPNQEITLTVTLNKAGSVVYGFEATAIDDQGKKAGDLSLTEPARTQIFTGVVNGNYANTSAISSTEFNQTERIRTVGHSNGKPRRRAWGR